MSKSSLAVLAFRKDVSVSPCLCGLRPYLRTPFCRIDVLDVLREGPPMAADIFRCVLTDAERHLLRLFQNHRARRLRFREMLVDVLNIDVRILRHGVAGGRFERAALLADDDRSVTDIHL